jgi:hypothetical protein
MFAAAAVEMKSFAFEKSVADGDIADAGADSG